MKDGFQQELTVLINRHCVENASNTPDFILAEYISACLQAFQCAANRRDEWRSKPIVKIPVSCAHDWPGPGEMPKRWDCKCGAIVYRSYSDYCWD